MKVLEFLKKNRLLELRRGGERKEVRFKRTRSVKRVIRRTIIVLMALLSKFIVSLEVDFYY